MLKLILSLALLAQATPVTLTAQVQQESRGANSPNINGVKGDVNIPPQPPSTPQSLSHEEQLELENLQLKNALVAQQQAEIQKAFAALQEEIKRAHPGYQLMGNELRPMPTEKPKTEGKPPMRPPTK